MSVRLGAAISDGLSRIFTRTGAILFVLILVFELVFITAVNSLIAGFVPQEVSGQLGLVLDLPPTVAGVIAIVGFVFTAVYFVTITRALTRPHTELASFPATLYTRRIVPATIAILIGGIITFILIFIGFIFLIIPGLFLAASFLFFIFAVGVEDHGPISGLKRSWALARGNRLKLILFVILVAVTSGIISTVPALFEVAGLHAAGDLVTALLNSILYIIIYGILAALYLQLVDTNNAPTE